MGHSPAVPPLHPDDAALAPPPDDQNIALADARIVFLGTVIGAGLFIGSVVAFIL